VSSTVWIRVLVLSGLAYSLYLAFSKPLNIDEAQIWADLIRPPFREAVTAPDAWQGILYAVVAKRIIGVLRLSEFALRLPAILAGIGCAWTVWKQNGLFLAMIYALAAAFGWFSTAQGNGIAIACCLLPGSTGWRIGVAIAFSPAFALLLLIYWKVRDIERITLPAIVTAFILLIIPASHAGPTTSSDHRRDFHLEANRRNAARGGGFQPPASAYK
jgi:hypothetical protein